MFSRIEPTLLFELVDDLVDGLARLLVLVDTDSRVKRLHHVAYVLDRLVLIDLALEIFEDTGANHAGGRHCDGLDNLVLYLV